MRAFVDVSYLIINLRLKTTPPLPKELDVKYIIISLLDRASKNGQALKSGQLQVTASNSQGIFKIPPNIAETWSIFHFN